MSFRPPHLAIYNVKQRRQTFASRPAIAGKIDSLMSGLATVAAALNANDQCLARIAAVHLKIPDLSDDHARYALEFEDALIKVGLRQSRSVRY